MLFFSILIAIFSVIGQINSDPENGDSVARWCTISSLEQNKCQDMKLAFQNSNLSPEIDCVQEISPEKCMYAIRDGYADLVTLDGGDVYLAGKVFNMTPIMEEIYPGNIRGYYAVAVVKANNSAINITNLAGRRSCHTGYGRTAGWNIPVGYLLGSGQMSSAGCQSSMLSAARFFNKSCAPGVREAAPWYINQSDINNLCGACHGTCTPSGLSEIYNGYTGAFRCLVEDAGDVAFVKPATVYSNTNNPNGFSWARSLQLSDFQLLCNNGTRANISQAASCHLAQSPPHGVMTSGSKSQTVITQYQNLLSSAQTIFGSDLNTEGFKMFDSVQYSGSNLLFKDSAQSLSSVNASYEGFLRPDYVQSVMGMHKCPEGSVRFCTTSQQELKKCEAMRVAFDTAGLTPSISCFQSIGYSECMAHIAAGYADMVTLDGGDIYKAGSQFNLVPIMGEDYGSGDASYWAVAVARRGSNFGIRNLNGKKSCHTGIMKTSGWIVPIGYLIQEEFIPCTNVYDVPTDVGNFFNHSCVPGAKSSAYDPSGSNPANLCTLCIGSGDDKCARNSHEPYYGYAGAFRCLAESAGDVAFVKHTTVSDNTSPNGQSDWSSSLKKEDYQLLCLDGQRANIDNYTSCNLAQVPSHALMTKNKSPQQIRTIVELFTAAVALFGSDANTAGFKLFDSVGYLDSNGNTGKNLLFKDSALNLTDVGIKKTYQSWLGNDYLRTLKGINCEGIN